MPIWQDYTITLFLIIISESAKPFYRDILK